MVIPKEKIFIAPDGTTLTVLIDEEAWLRMIKDATGRDLSSPKSEKDGIYPLPETLYFLEERDHSTMADQLNLPSSLVIKSLLG